MVVLEVELPLRGDATLTDVDCKGIKAPIPAMGTSRTTANFIIMTYVRDAEKIMTVG